VFVLTATFLLVNEAFLGALLVKLGYVTGNRSIGRVLVLSIHLSNTLLLLAALTLTALMLGTRQMWASLRSEQVSGREFALAGLLATLVVGVSGSLAALGDTLFPAASLSAAMAQDFAAGSPLLLRLRWVHPASAVIAALFVIWLVRRAGWMRSRLVVWLLVLQFALGLADIVLLAPTWMQIVHLLGADLYWIALVVLAARVVWPKRGDATKRAKLKF
jgi:cytochrome c oxidase assembly protein subunit 15